jgi:gamma-glutamyltranspeptidase/glutathione hydrolase
MIKVQFFSFLFSFNFILISCSTEKPIRGAVVSAREEASKIGVAIMAKGGNAFDAMIATPIFEASSRALPTAPLIGFSVLQEIKMKLKLKRKLKN